MLFDQVGVYWDNVPRKFWMPAMDFCLIYREQTQYPQVPFASARFTDFVKTIMKL